MLQIIQKLRTCTEPARCVRRILNAPDTITYAILKLILMCTFKMKYLYRRKIYILCLKVGDVKIRIFFTFPISGEHVNVIFLTLAEERVFVKYTFTVHSHFVRYNSIKKKYTGVTKTSNTFQLVSLHVVIYAAMTLPSARETFLKARQIVFGTTFTKHNYRVWSE